MENHDLFLVLCPGADASHGQKVQELLAKHGRCAQMLEQSWLLAVDPERVDSGESDADAIIEERGLKQVSDSGAIEAVVDRIIADNPDKVAEYKGGKDKHMGWFVGPVMKASQGKANPQMANEVLSKKLND